MMPMEAVAYSNERPQLMQYLDKHDGQYVRYKYFTRPIIRFMSGEEPTGESSTEEQKKRWDVK